VIPSQELRDAASAFLALNRRQGVTDEEYEVAIERLEQALSRPPPFEVKNGHTAEELGIKCPECGGTNIGHGERMIVCYKVAGWRPRNEHGETMPASFHGSVNDPGTTYIIPDTQEDVDFPYYCLDCNSELADEECGISHSPEDDDE
jgi:hypothetical protein